MFGWYPFVLEGFDLDASFQLLWYTVKKIAISSLNDITIAQKGFINGRTYLYINVFLIIP